jgi:hypothetical protein
VAAEQKRDMNIENKVQRTQSKRLQTNRWSGNTERCQKRDYSKRYWSQNRNNG